MKMKQFDSQHETILEHGYLSDLQQISLELGIKLVHFHRKEVCDSKIVSKLLLMLLRAGVETRIFRHMFFIIKWNSSHLAPKLSVRFGRGADSCMYCVSVLSMIESKHRWRLQQIKQVKKKETNKLNEPKKAFFCKVIVREKLHFSRNLFMGKCFVDCVSYDFCCKSSVRHTLSIKWSDTSSTSSFSWFIDYIYNHLISPPRSGILESRCCQNWNKLGMGAKL